MKTSALDRNHGAGPFEAAIEGEEQPADERFLAFQTASIGIER